MEPHSNNKDFAASSESEDPGPGSPSQNSLRMPSGDTFRKSQQADSGQSSASFFQIIGNLFRGNSNGHNAQNGNSKQETSLKEAVEALIEEHTAEGGELYILPEEQNMLRNILRFGEMTVSDIMIPRTDITAVEQSVTLDEIKQIIVNEQHSRIPVYKENLDQINGFLHIKDIAVNVFAEKPFNMDNLIRQILFVPPSMKVMDLLVRMRHSSVHIAIVVDEYGGTDGLVSMEDIVEEIVGEIQDEHDEAEDAPTFIWLNERTLEADARMEVEELDKCFGASMVMEQDEEDFDTIGGLVFSHLGHIPETGEQFDYPTGMRITILEAEPRAVKRVRIERLENIHEYESMTASAK
jgi:CBS domain containing-hemolysin-like protein